MPNQFITLCLVGGVGSGKSTLAKWLGDRFSIPVVDADKLGHVALKQPEVIEQLLERFGSGIVGSDGEIDRSELGGLVWGDDSQAVQARRDLERIVHPVIQGEMREAIEKARREGKRGIVIDAAVVIEAGWHQFCDRLIFVDTPEEKRVKHVIDSRNWSEQELKKRERSQLDLETKRKYAHFVVDNSGSVEQSGQQLVQWLHREYGWPIES